MKLTLIRCVFEKLDVNMLYKYIQHIMVEANVKNC